MKTTSPFAGLLRQSPFRRVQEHMRIVFQCVSEIPALFDALIEKDQERIKTVSDRIGSLESQADRLKDEFRGQMPKPLLLAVDRRDILELINEQDSIADIAERICGILAVREMEVPETIEALLLELIQKTTDICSLAAEVIEQLDELLAVGFVGKQYDIVTHKVAAVKRSEHNIDELLIKLNRALFSLEDQLKPVSVILWYHLIELIGEISNKAENVGDRLMLFLSK
ncbi:MAG: TIGR00153 family protein [Deltaproteobacteria bacterium]|nr:TIGR00153 family protein [Deltaproteobacteria bacterium]